MLSNVFVKEGQAVKKNQPLFVIEAMKMETTVTAPEDVTIRKCGAGRWNVGGGG
jgi:pyruvate carboxylase